VIALREAPELRDERTLRETAELRPACGPGDELTHRAATGLRRAAEPGPVGAAGAGEAGGTPLPLRGSRYRWHGAPGEGTRALETGRGPTARGPVGTEALPFRRRAVRPRRRRRSLWVRLLGPLATAALLVGAPAALAGWMLTTPRFALREIAIDGTERVPREWVERAVEPFRGEHLLTLRLDRVEAAVAGHPWIASVSIAKRLPDGVAVQVAERRAAALVPAPASEPADGPWLADAEGRPIVRASAEEAEGLALVVPSPWDAGGGEGSRRVAAVPAALALAREIARAEPVWAAGLERLESLGGGDFRVWTAALPFPVLVEQGRLEPAAERLGDVLPALAARRPELGRVAEADLRFAGRLVLRPAPEDGGTAGDRPAGAEATVVPAGTVEVAETVGNDGSDGQPGAGATAAPAAGEGSDVDRLESRATDRREVG